MKFSKFPPLKCASKIIISWASPASTLATSCCHTFWSCFVHIPHGNWLRKLTDLVFTRGEDH